MKVAVLGCGPAGLLATHAAVLHGAEVDIYSRKEPSKIHGAQYVHEAIPEVCEGPPQQISYAKMGDSTGYAEKVYGTPLAPTSWAAFPQGEYPAWPMEGVYALLWTKYEQLIRHAEITAESVKDFLAADVYDLVFCSIPAPSICLDSGHQFTSASVVFEPERKVEMSNAIVYNGRTSEPWYRTSSLFGHDWTEYPARLFIGEDLPKGWMRGIKPMDSSCRCFVENSKLVRVGRFGRWSKKILVTDAYKEAVHALQ